jgi:hypothetical protein
MKPAYCERREGHGDLLEEIILFNIKVYNVQKQIIACKLFLANNK